MRAWLAAWPCKQHKNSLVLSEMNGYDKQQIRKMPNA